MICIGIDPASIRLGYAILGVSPRGSLSYVDAGVITANPRHPAAARLAEISRGLDEVIAEAQRARVGDDPIVGAIEAGYAIAGGRGRSTIVLAEARGLVMRAFVQAGIEWKVYAPATVKKAVTGRGDASKELVARCVRQLLGMRRTPGFDCADAIAAAVVRATEMTLSSVEPKAMKARDAK